MQEHAALKLQLQNIWTAAREENDRLWEALDAAEQKLEGVDREVMEARLRLLCAGSLEDPNCQLAHQVRLCQSLRAELNLLERKVEDDIAEVRRNFMLKDGVVAPMALVTTAAASVCGGATS